MKTLVMMRTRGFCGPMFQKLGPRTWVKGKGNSKEMLPVVQGKKKN